MTRIEAWDRTGLAIRFDSFAETNMQLFDYIETVHNQRRHSTLGQISPAAFE